MNRTEKIDFCLLLLYSLLPGFSKVFNSDLFMLMYVPLILYWLVKYKLHFFSMDIPFILFFVFVFLYSLIICVDYKTNKTSIFLGFGLDFVPMLGFFAFRGRNLRFLFKSIVLIVFIHSIIGIYLYPMFRLANFSSPIIKALVDGVAFGRMASVSGSLGFGNLVLIGFVIAFYFNKKMACFFILPLIFSAQRSAWMGGLITVALYMFFLFKRGKILSIYKFIFVITLAFIVLFFIIQRFVDFDFSFILSRFENLFNGASENGNVRMKLWQNGIDNFLSNPMGTGIGQVGQVGTRYAASVYKVCPDGDYFRMLSEYGINFLIFFEIVVFLFMILPFVLCEDKTQQCLYTISFVTAVQLIGSNVTEFYFDNFLFWLFLGQNFYYARFLIKRGARV